MFSTPEEDEMGSPQPSAAALEAADVLYGYILKHTPLGTFAPSNTNTTRDEIARALDAYATAALTDEQRDVLTVWERLNRPDGNGGEWAYDYVDFWDNWKTTKSFYLTREGPDWLHAAAQWCREQGAQGER